MEKKMMGLLCFVMVLLAMSCAKQVYGITCGEAVLKLLPCENFLVGNDASPSAPCCLAVNTLNQVASTKEIRKEICECFKKSYAAYGVKPDKAKQLPGLCNVAVPVPIDPNIDCDTIN